MPAFEVYDASLHFVVRFGGMATMSFGAAG